MGAREDSNTVPIGNNPEPICANPISEIFRSVSKRKIESLFDKSRGDVQ